MIDTDIDLRVRSTGWCWCQFSVVFGNHNHAVVVRLQTWYDSRPTVVLSCVHPDGAANAKGQHVTGGGI